LPCDRVRARFHPAVFHPERFHRLQAYSETPVGFVRVLSRPAKFKSYSRFRASHFFAKFLNRIPLCILEYLQMFFYANMINDER
jgi:hypothetical protein